MRSRLTETAGDCSKNVPSHPICSTVYTRGLGHTDIERGHVEFDKWGSLTLAPMTFPYRKLIIGTTFMCCCGRETTNLLHFRCSSYYMPIII